MARLIDADKLIEDLQSQIEFDKYTPNSTGATINLATLLFIDKIKEQSTAYDVNKIVKELEHIMVYEVLDGLMKGEWIKKEQVLKIVKECGKNE